MISPDGNFLYASNRGEDTLVVFAINDGGSLKEVQRISCGGKTPRHFTFDPTFQWILCGNQDSGSITVFRRDQGTGKLTGPTQTVSIDSPMYTLFA
jgi:6-phosphogluconolactonase